MKISRELLQPIILAAERSEKAGANFENKYYPDGHNLDLDFEVVNGELVSDSKYYMTDEYRAMDDAEKALIKSFDAFDYDTVVEIESLMYLGRDFNLNADCPDYTEQKCFEDLFNRFEKQDKGDRQIPIMQMTEKATLSKYLKDGLDKLGL